MADDRSGKPLPTEPTGHPDRAGAAGPAQQAVAELFGGEPVLTFQHEADRRTFLRYSALVGVGAALVAGAKGDPSAFARPAGAATSGTSANDLDILNYALTLEYLEAEFYTRGVAAGLLDGRELELVTPIRDHEQIHVSTLVQVVRDLGGTPVAKPTITFPKGVFSSRSTFLTTAQTFEEVGITAYHGQVPLIRSGDILLAAASIAGVESRHASVIATLIGRNPFPRPIEANASMKTVIGEVKPFLS